MGQPETLGALRAGGYEPRSIKAEMRANLLRKLRENEPVFPGIRGYDDTVFPQVFNAVLSRHDMLFLGLRGQGKTRMLRMLVNLLDDEIPIVAGSEINDDPFAPLSKFARDRIAEAGDDTPIAWIPREQRYHEKLATPDVTIADLIGEVDLIKHAEGRHLASEDVMHFGLIPRSNRGLFCMNELPDLAPKIQVGLFNVLEERDVQIRGFTIRLPLDLCLMFSANPEDYTNRGRIVTPLKDRIGSVIRTHYPLARETGVAITDDNAWTDRDAEVEVIIPSFMKDLIEEISRLARSSPHVNQASGVSVRMSVANYENAISNAERRALATGENPVVLRLSDLSHLSASSRGKMELAMSEEPGEEDKLVTRLVEEAARNIFDEFASPKQFRNVIEYFDSGTPLVVGDHLSSAEALSNVGGVSGFFSLLDELATKVASDLALDDALRASLAELVLEALYTHNRLNKKQTTNRREYGL